MSSASSVSADPALETIVARYLSGEISAPVALMQLLIETEDFAVVRSLVERVAREPTSPSARDVRSGRLGTEGAKELQRAEEPARAKELEQLMTANAAGCERIAAMLRADVDSSKPAATVDEGIAFSERLFDWSVQQSEEASVALYSLGNPDLLQRATTEIVSQLEKWGAVTPETVLLDIGCGIGRLLTALAPSVRNATGIDVSAEMVKAAQRRCASIANVSVVKGDGRGLAPFGDATFDVAIAVDSFPYIRQSGYPLAETFLAEAGRVLKPGGQLVILNYSYSEDDAGDVREVRDLAARSGFEVLAAGERVFELWDGVAFRLVRSSRD